MKFAVRLLLFTFLFCLQVWHAGAQVFNVSPLVAYPGKAVPVTVNGFGTHFSVWPAKTKVILTKDSFVYTPKITIVSDKEITFTAMLPSTAPTGSYMIYVSDSSEGQLSYDLFSVQHKGIPSVEIKPDTLVPGIKKLTLVLIGTNTWFDYPFGTFSAWLQHGSYIIDLGHTPPTQQTIENINIPADAPIGKYDFYARDSFDSTIRTPDAIIMKSSALPAITGFDPDTATLGTTTTIHFTGSGTHFPYIYGHFFNVWFKNGNDSFNITNMAHLTNTGMEKTFNIPYTRDTGYYTVTVTDLYDGQMTAPKKMHILPNKNVRILSTTPASAVPGQAFIMKVKATNTHFKAGPANVWLSQNTLKITPLSTTVIDDETINAYFKLSPNVLISTGVWDINIKDDIDNTMTVPHGFSIPYPKSATLVCATPDSIVRDGAGYVTLSGIKTKFNPNSKFYIFNQLNQASYAVIDNIVSPTEVMVHFYTDSYFDYGAYTIYYIDSAVSTELSTPFYIVDKLGIDAANENNSNSLRTYPNPFKNIFTVSYDLQKQSAVSFEISDILGRIVYTRLPQNENAGPHQSEINLGKSNCAPGIYLLRVHAGLSYSDTKIIKAE